MDLISTLRYEAKKRAEESGVNEQKALQPELAEAFSLRGRTAVITGGGKGIGAGAALVLAQAGANVVLADVDKEGLDETVGRIRELGVGATAVPTDVNQRTEVDALAQQALDEHGRIDIWANVAGIIRESKVVDVTEDDFETVMGLNLAGTLWGCQAAVRAMEPAGRGSIINFASAAADLPSPGVPVYAMSKAGVVSLTRMLAVEEGGHGIRVNAIAPGFIDTPMTQRHFRQADGSVDEDAKAALHNMRAKQVPLKMTGEPSDIAYAVLYLASDAARFVTGQTLRPNGGIAML